MLLPSPSMWKIIKDTPNNVPMNTNGLAQTSIEILEEGDVSILPVVLSTADSLHFNCDPTRIPLSTFYVDVNKICIWLYVQWQSAT